MTLTGFATAAPLPAAAHHASPGVLVLLALGLLAAWAVSVLLWPNAPCSRCQGSGKSLGSNGKRWGRCRRCKGTGTRQRFGSKAVRRAVGRKKR